MKKNLLYIGNKLSGKGSNVTTIETLGNLLFSEGYQVRYASDKSNQSLRLLDMLCKTFFLRKKADYVLIDTYSTSAFWYAFLTSQLCRLLKMKYIPILHGGNLPCRLQKNPKLCRMLFAHAYQNVAPSHYLLHAFQLAGYANLRFIPNTIEIQKYPFKMRNKVAPKLLWVRAFASLYHPKMAVDVLKILQQKYPDAQLCMVGPEKDGSLKTTQDYAREQGVTVLFTGRLSKEEWIALSDTYDIFINTTHFDNTPVSVMEALALGLPVVSTNVGGIPYLLEEGESGLLVPDGDVIEMTAAIERLINNHDLAKTLSIKGRNKAELWDWNIVKKQWTMLLQ